MKYRAAMIIYEWFWIFTIAASPCISRTHSEQRNLNVSLKVDRSEKFIWSHFEEMVKTERNEKYKKHSVLTSARVPQLQQQWAGGGEQAWTPSWQFGIWKNWKLKIEGEQAWTPSWQFGIWKNWKLKIEGEQAWTPSWQFGIWKKLKIENWRRASLDTIPTIWDLKKLKIEGNSFFSLPKCKVVFAR